MTPNERKAREILEALIVGQHGDHAHATAAYEANVALIFHALNEAEAPLRAEIENLAMLVRMLAVRLDPRDESRIKAVGYLKRHGLMGSILREERPPCSRCGGSGLVPDGPFQMPSPEPCPDCAPPKCQRCNGTGRIVVHHAAGGGRVGYWQGSAPCPDCAPKLSAPPKCGTCGGSGRIDLDCHLPLHSQCEEPCPDCTKEAK